MNKKATLKLLTYVKDEDTEIFFFNIWHIEQHQCIDLCLSSMKHHVCMKKRPLLYFIMYHAIPNIRIPIYFSNSDWELSVFEYSIICFSSIFTVQIKDHKTAWLVNMVRASCWHNHCICGSAYHQSSTIYLGYSWLPRPLKMTITKWPYVESGIKSQTNFFCVPFYS